MSGIARPQPSSRHAGDTDLPVIKAPGLLKAQVPRRVVGSPRFGRRGGWLEKHPAAPDANPQPYHLCAVRGSCAYAYPQHRTPKLWTNSGLFGPGLIR
jgi:hypothetical protein